MSDLFLDGEDIKGQEAKWNMFRFQDHLLSWISLSAEYFHKGQYSLCFESLTNVYTDVWGFFDDSEKAKIDKLFNKVRASNNSFQEYNDQFNQTRKANSVYEPPVKIYDDLLEFRKELLALMTKYKLTIPTVKKAGSGMGSA